MKDKLITWIDNHVNLIDFTFVTIASILTATLVFTYLFLIFSKL